MKIIFWNIGNSFTIDKENCVKDLIQEKNPDIFCIAEGTTSISNCQYLEKQFVSFGFQTYYIPTFYNTPIIGNQYGWNKFGLKLFTKKGIAIPAFTFSEQQLEGRITFLRIKDCSIFFVHGMSKADDIPQYSFIVELYNFLKAKQLLFPDNKILIMGDFNIEPWENDLLSYEKYIYSHFYLKRFDFFKKYRLNKVFYNPILECIQNHADKDLIGTFYNPTHTSILDYFLITDYIEKYDIEIINEIKGLSLLQKKTSKILLKNEFDHLPIQIIPTL